LDRNRLGTLILGACLVLALAVSIDLGRRLGGERSELRARMAMAEAALRSCDTLQAANMMLLAEVDSLERYRNEAMSLRTRLLADSMALTYPDYYLIIDTGQNRFHLRRGSLLVRSGYCGTGKGWTANDIGNAWDFSTPRGLRYVVGNGQNPYWFRPDWYWLEQNMRPPDPEEVVMIPESLSYSEQVAWYNDSLTPQQRVYVRQVPGVLGSYKIDLGGGVLLHYGGGRGTNVSHGCIRLGAADLEALYRTLPVGAPVLIY
jgi:L,D-transpeptidase YbiS